MSQTANKTAVGAFVIIAAALAFVCIVFFGNISFGKKSEQYVIYVTDSVNGLDVGSAVKFKGVKIGSVKSVMYKISGQRSDDFSIPIIIEIDRSPVQASPENLSAAIAHGLRARLQMTSIVTGLLYVDLDFIPDVPAVFRGEEKLENIPEIPTVPSNTNRMMKAVATILQDLAGADLAGLSAQIKHAVQSIDDGVSKIEFGKINDNVVRLTGSAAEILEDPELKKTAANVNRLIANIDALSGEIAAQVDPVSQEIKSGLSELRATLAEIGLAIHDFQKMLSPQQGSLGQEFGETLVQINDAARAIRALTDHLQIRVSAGDTGTLPPQNAQ